MSLEHSEGSLLSEDALDTEDDALDTGDDLDVSVDGIDTPDETDSLELNGQGKTQTWRPNTSADFFLSKNMDRCRHIIAMNLINTQKKEDMSTIDTVLYAHA